MNIPSWVEHYISIPYEEVDCWGLVQLVYKEVFDIELPGVTEQRDLIRSGEWIDVFSEGNGIQVPDVLLFKNTAIKKHVGIILTGDYMLHTESTCGTSVIERWTARYWKPRLMAIYRCKKLT